MGDREVEYPTTFNKFLISVGKSTLLLIKFKFFVRKLRLRTTQQFPLASHLVGECIKINLDFSYLSG